ncbi:MAG: helix-turn-helix domain-containing protein [Acutalibacteraceae bacterium]
MSCFDEGTGNTFDLNRIQIALYLMENRGRVVTKAMLLEQLWDIDGNFVDDNTVRVNIKRLRQKLNDEKQEYIVTVFGMGYSLENDDEAFCDL